MRRASNRLKLRWPILGGRSPISGTNVGFHSGFLTRTTNGLSNSTRCTPAINLGLSSLGIPRSRNGATEDRIALAQTVREVQSGSGGTLRRGVVQAVFCRASNDGDHN